MAEFENYVEQPEWLIYALRALRLPTLSPYGMAKIENSFAVKGAYSVVLQMPNESHSNNVNLHTLYERQQDAAMQTIKNSNTQAVLITCFQNHVPVKNTNAIKVTIWQEEVKTVFFGSSNCAPLS